MSKEKFELEFGIRATKSILYNRFTTPSGLSEWFADDVNIKKDMFTFIWEGSEERAKMLTKKKDEFVRYRWEEDIEEGNDYFFEMRIKIDALTGDVAIIITDFADPDELEEAGLLWESQINELKHIMGA